MKNYSFLINLIKGIGKMIDYHGTESHDIWIKINNNQNKVRFVGEFTATPDFLNEFTELCVKHFNKEND